MNERGTNSSDKIDSERSAPMGRGNENDPLDPRIRLENERLLDQRTRRQRHDFRCIFLKDALHEHVAGIDYLQVGQVSTEAMLHDHHVSGPGIDFVNGFESLAELECGISDGVAGWVGK